MCYEWDMNGMARDLEHALHRVVALGEDAGSGQPHALTGPRRAILNVVRAHGAPMTLDQITQQTTMHANTTRHHLDVLAAAGLLERTSAPPTGRGRPRTLYGPSATASAAYSELGDRLRAALQKNTGDEVIRETARRWIKAAPPVRMATDVDDAVAVVVDSMRSVGFTAQTDAVADTIVVRDCPYASLIAEHPMICTLHAELVSNVLENTGQPVELEAFDVWVRPGVCRARLTRPDAAPLYIATPTNRPVPTKESQ